jgi:nucleotide-binding universal stress UspA family protein
MQTIKHILAALCLSELSDGIYRLAVEMADRFDADLTVINVININDIERIGTIEAMGYDVHSRDYRIAIKEDRRERLETLIKQFRVPQKQLQKLVLVGHPVEEILKVISQEHIDMVVIGAKGHSNLPYLLVGSVAEKVFRHSPVTVVSHRNDPREDFHQNN